MTSIAGSRRLFAVLTSALVACAPDAAPTAVARDSAGIRIVENDRAAWGENKRWRVGSEPTIDIGRGDSTTEYLLHRVVSGRRLGDGRIALTVVGSADVRIFDATGRHLMTIGRRGEGPGEFRSPWRVMQLAGDSLLVLDIGRGFRFNVFGPNGAFVRTFTTPIAHGAEGTEMIGWFSDGSSLVRRHEYHQPRTPTTGVTRSHVSLFRLAPDGIMLDSLGLFPNQTSSNPPYMWGPWAHEAVHDSTVFFGSADSFEILRYTWHGELRGIIRRSRPNMATTAADVAAFKEESRRQFRLNVRDARTIPVLERRLEETRFASHFPAYFRLETDLPGNLWVQEYSRHIGEGRNWSVFDTAGVYRGDVEMPERFRVFQIGDDFVLGQWRDGDDVEHIRLYPLIKPDR